MKPSRTDNLIQKIAGLSILLVITIVPFLYWHDSSLGNNPDPFTYLQHTKDVLGGRKLYSDVTFDKGPLSILIYAIPEWVAPRSYRITAFFLAICLVIESLVFIWVFRRDLATGLACTLIIAVLPLTHADWVWLGTEHASNIFITGALAVAICISRKGRFSWWQCMLAGLLVCFALNVRQTGLFAALIPATAILYCPQPIRRKIEGIGWSILGGILGLGIVLIWVSIISDIHAYIYKFFLYPASYAENGTWADSGKLLADAFSNPVGGIIAIFLLITLLDFRVWKSSGPLILAALAAGLISVVLPRRVYPHYWVGFMPYLAMAVGIGLYEIGAKRRLISVAASAVILCLCAVDFGELFARATENPDTILRQQIAEKADKLAPPNSTLLVWGPMGSESIVYASRQSEASKYWILWEMDPPRDKLLPIAVGDIYNEYLSHPPTEIVAYTRWKDLMESEDESKDSPVLAGQFELARLLLKKYDYHFDVDFNGFEIGLLAGPAKPSTEPISPR